MESREGVSDEWIGRLHRSDPSDGFQRKIVWAEVQIWVPGGKSVPLGPRAIFLDRPTRPRPLRIVPKNPKYHLIHNTVAAQAGGQAAFDTVLDSCLGRNDNVVAS